MTEPTQEASAALAKKIIRQYYNERNSATVFVHACAKIMITMVLGGYEDQTEGLKTLKSLLDEIYSEAARDVYKLEGKA